MHTKTLLIILLVATTSILHAQEYNPYKSIGKKGKIVTAYGNRFVEVFDYDTIQRIGSVLINTRTKKIVKLLDSTTLLKKYSDNSSSSRWYSVDPLAAKGKNISVSPYVFVGDNPISRVDPDGRDWHISITQDKKGNWMFNVTYTAAIVNESGAKIDLNKFKAAITKQLESSFKGSLGKLFGTEFSLKTTANIRVIDKESALKKNESLYRILKNTDSRIAGDYAAANKLGGKIVNVNQDFVQGMINESDQNTISHETGHTGYLFHPEVPTTTQGGSDAQQFLQIVEGQYFQPQANGQDKNNAMYSGDSGYLNDKTSTEINSTQLRALVINYYLGLLNQN